MNLFDFSNKSETEIINMLPAIIAYISNQTETINTLESIKEIQNNHIEAYKQLEIGYKDKIEFLQEHITALEGIVEDYSRTLQVAINSKVCS